MADSFKSIFGPGVSARGGGRKGTTTLTSQRFTAEGERIAEPRSISNQQILSGTFTALGSFGDIAGGFQESAALKSEGRQLDREAREASLRGVSEAINESVRATKSLGSQFVADTAAFTGSSANVLSSELEDVTTNINIARFSAEERSLLLRAAARRARKSAKRAVIGGFIKAGSRAGSFFGAGG